MRRKCRHINQGRDSRIVLMGETESKVMVHPPLLGRESGPLGRASRSTPSFDSAVFLPLW